MKNLEKSLSSEIRKAAQILKNGGVVIFPTDTVYGIGCIFDNKKALSKIYRIKSRPQTLPFPILVSSTSQAESLGAINSLARKLIEKYWPGGLTIIIKNKENNGKIGVRMPDSDVVKELIKAAEGPIVGTSANFHGHKSVSDFDSLDPKLTRLADFTIEGECKRGRESTVVDTTKGKLEIIRQGAVKLSITN